MPKLVIVDGYSLLFRAFFAMPFLSNSAGEPTGAVHGFATMLLKLLDEERPDAMVVAWDAPGGTFRDASYAEYKANRASAPDEFRSQVPAARELVPALGIRALELNGYEADDCIGAAARHGVEEGYDVRIVSGDTDMLQLVGPHVEVVIPRRGITDVVTYDAAAVEERYGVPPERFVDFKALKGDSSDNIPGVKGIGEKTAAELIRTWGSLDGLYEHLGEVKPDRVRTLLEAGRESATMSFDLSRIRADAPCDLEPESCKLMPPRMDAVRELFNRMEFRALLARAEALAASRSPSGGEPSAATGFRNLEGERAEDLLEALATARRSPPLAVAIRSDPWAPGVGGLGELAWASASEVAWLPVEEGGLPAPVARALADPSLPKTMHDAKPLMKALEASGAPLAGLDLDVMIAGYLLFAGRWAPTLDILAAELLGRSLPDARAVGPAGRERLASEALAVRDLAPLLRERLVTEGLWSLYADLEAPLIPILAAMERRGVLLDPEALTETSAFLSGRIGELEEAVFTLAGAPFNIGSTRQLQDVLFEKLGLPRGKKTKTGYSTGSDVLEELAVEFPIVRMILDWREVSKLRSTYTDALLRLMDPETRRIHTRFNQAVAATGRLSSAEPNLQNIPIRTEVGREIRRAFVAPAGHLLLSADYSQIELRILAHVTGEPALVHAFTHDEDVHSSTAALIFGVPLSGVTADMRRRAKTVNFAVLYGQTDFGLSKELGIPVSEARAFIAQYFTRFPNIKGYADGAPDEARRLGYNTTLIGRRRYFPDIESPNRNARLFAERAAVNNPLQGTAADIIKQAMVNLERRIAAEGIPARLLLQVHDELLFEVPEEALQPTARMVREEMEGAFPLSVPTRVEMKAGRDWKEMERVEG